MVRDAGWRRLLSGSAVWSAERTSEEYLQPHSRPRKLSGRREFSSAATAPWQGKNAEELIVKSLHRRLGSVLHKHAGEH